jgi:hypothetical protein
MVGFSLVIGFTAALARRAHVPEPVFPAVYLTAAAAYFLVTRHPTAARLRSSVAAATTALRAADLGRHAETTDA